jgi:hypothetical protein
MQRSKFLWNTIHISCIPNDRIGTNPVQIVFLQKSFTTPAIQRTPKGKGKVRENA